MDICVLLWERLRVMTGQARTPSRRRGCCWQWGTGPRSPTAARACSAAWSGALSVRDRKLATLAVAVTLRPATSTRAAAPRQTLR